MATSGIEEVIEGVGKQHNFASLARLLVRGEPLAEAARGKARQRTILVQAQGAFRHASQRRSRNGIDERGNLGGQRRPFVDFAEELGPQRPRMLLIVVVEELRLVDGHVHRRRTLRLAALAGQAHFHAFADGFVGKTAGEDLSIDGLEQHVNAPASGESLIARGLERRTHGAGVQLAALANAHAAREGAADAAIGAEVEHRWNRLRAVARHAQERVSG